MDFKLIAIIICSILLVFLLFKEFSRNDKARLIWRILASIFSVASLLFLLIPLQYKTSAKQNLNEINLITEGTEPDSALKIKSAKYSLKNTEATELKHGKTIQIPDLFYFLKEHPEVNKINIYGYGLSLNELEKLKDFQLNFHPSNNITGIIDANWPNEIKTTAQFLLQGIYKNTESNTIKLLLNGLGKSIDSVNIKPNETVNFSFKTQPKQIGKAVFKLIALNGKDTISNEPVPFIVNEQAAMKVLILSSFPDFEYKFLKKWLFDNQYPLAYRSKISKDKYTTDFLNLSNVNLNSINQAALKQFDVLIIDEDEISSLSGAEKSTMQTAMNNGLGVIIRIANPKSSGFISDKFSRFEVPLQKDKGLIPIIKDDAKKFNKLPYDQRLFLKASENNQTIVIDNNAKILVTSKLNGLGKLTASTLSSTYNWMLAGNEADYSAYWSALLSKTARKKAKNLAFKVLPKIPVVNHRTNFVIDLAQNNKVPTIKMNGLVLAPRQNMELPFQWDVTNWPKTQGWNTLNINQTTASVYIYAKQNWQTLRNYSLIKQNERFVQNNLKQLSKAKISEQITVNEVSKWWIFITFILSTGFLWFESRVLRKN
ncbi:MULTISPECIES: hypothetical protein [unclassified Pedobacter]|uniref:hypothetical protein n=1 Tax=unclassified Pedobacter TaxID=2628915 RepID=UPI001E5DE82F|nr:MULTISPECIES: hypothetical protein [unclassified Pedobacter]